MSIRNQDFNDFISFLDEDNKKIEFYVKILEINSVVKFETKSQNIISIPIHRVLKIKQKSV